MLFKKTAYFGPFDRKRLSGSFTGKPSKKALEEAKKSPYITPTYDEPLLTRRSASLAMGAILAPTKREKEYLLGEMDAMPQIVKNLNAMGYSDEEAAELLEGLDAIEVAEDKSSAETIAAESNLTAEQIVAYCKAREQYMSIFGRDIKDVDPRVSEPDENGNDPIDDGLCGKIVKLSETAVDDIGDIDPLADEDDEFEDLRGEAANINPQSKHPNKRNDKIAQLEADIDALAKAVNELANAVSIQLGQTVSPFTVQPNQPTGPAISFYPDQAMRNVQAQAERDLNRSSIKSVPIPPETPNDVAVDTGDAAEVEAKPENANTKAKTTKKATVKK